MKRRDFLKITPAAGLAAMVSGLPVSTFASHPLLELLAKQTQMTGRVMVLIQLNGGNDGLNTVIPLDQYSALSSARNNILIPQSKVLPLTGTGVTGLHPAMKGVRDLYNSGFVNITQGVSYPNPDYSHFRATDIWLTASDATQYLNTGWVGRYLDTQYKNYPTGYPSTTMPDPLAIQIGYGISPVLQGPNVNMGMAIADINSFYNIVNGTVDPAPSTPAGHELTFIRYIAQQTKQYNGVIQAAAQKANNLSTLYPTSGNSLSDQLKIVARLIAGGLQTPIYIVSMGSFDTHSGQTDATDTTIGTHANLLTQLSEAVYAFFDDLQKLGKFEDVAAMTFSEFGRRIVSNASGGTDHGSAEPVMVFGAGVNPGLLGNNPTIPANASASDNIAMQNDYRSVYSAVLADWFQISTQDMNTVLLQTYPILPIFKKTNNTGETTITGRDETLGQNYPNPFTRSAMITFGSEGGNVSIRLFDVNGRQVKTLVEGEYERGTYQLTIEREGLPSGVYFYRMYNGKNTATKQMIVID